MKELLLSKANYLKFVQNLSTRFSLYAPVQKGDFLFFEKVSKENIEKIVVDTKRTIHPLKSFFIPAHRKVSKYFTSFSNSGKQEDRIILGAKNCDLNALKILDSVYSGEKFGKEYKDPFYIEAREKTILIWG